MACIACAHHHAQEVGAYASLHTVMRSCMAWKHTMGKGTVRAHAVCWHQACSSQAGWFWQAHSSWAG